MEVLPLPQDDNLPAPQETTSQTCEKLRIITVRNKTIDLVDITNQVLKMMILDGVGNRTAWGDTTHVDEHKKYSDYSDHDKHKDYDDHNDYNVYHDHTKYDKHNEHSEYNDWSDYGGGSPGHNP